MEEKNWLKELVESSDFEYFDGENYEDDGEYATGSSRFFPTPGSRFFPTPGSRFFPTPGSRISSPTPAVGVEQGEISSSAPAVVVEQGKGVPLQASPIKKPSYPIAKLKASANPFTQYQQYNTVNSLFFDLIVKTTVKEQTGGGYPQDQTYEVPILYPFANTNQNYTNTLTNYGLLLKGSVVQYEEGSRFLLNNTLPLEGGHQVEVDGMSFNLSDLYNAILYRNLKLQINKIRFALQDQNDLAYLNTLTMYAIGITSKIQKDSLNAGSFVRPQDFNTYIVDVDMRIIVDYNSILTYQINTAMVDKPTSGDAVNTFRMSFFCNILK